MCVTLMNLWDHISKIVFFIPTKNLWWKLKFFKKQKSHKCTFCDSEKNQNIIDPQMNTTKLVVMTLPNNHEKEFVIRQKKF